MYNMYFNIYVCVSDAAVNSGEIWFINFYFPRCSHCHQLAPTVQSFRLD